MIELRPIDALKPSPTNARTHPAAQIRQIARSIEEWGWTIPILIDEDGFILAGHGRLLAAKSLGLKEARVIVARGWSEAQKRAYILADNKLAENATWDKDVLVREIGSIREGFGFDIGLMGYSADELHRLLKDRVEGEDEVPAPGKPRSRQGDIWQLGEHRLACGDATASVDVERLLAGSVPHLMVTDPPYGVSYDPAWRNKQGIPGHGLSREGVVGHDDRADWTDAWALFPGDAAYIWHASLASRAASASIRECGFTIRAQIIWAKETTAIGRGNYHWQHEPCFYAVRDESHWTGQRDQTTLWRIGSYVGYQTLRRGPEDEASELGAQKPVECMRRPMLNNSERGDAVYDPFVGAGTSIIAAETVGRSCLAMEIDPRYCDVAIARWEKFTGRKAKRA